MRKRSLYQVVLLGIIAILAAFALQGYYLWSAYKLKDQEFQQQVQVALLGVADGFEELNESLVPDVALINRISNNYYVVNLNAVIDAGDLQFLLQRELEAVGLNEDFEYGIYDCYTDRMVYGDYVSYEANADTLGRSRPELATYDEFIYYFGIRFPDHKTSLLNSLGTVGALGAVLLITILFFVYASWVLVRQQQLSEMQKDFINNMTHEFKTPLSTIKIASGVLARSAPVRGDARLLRYAEVVENQNERLTNQVEKVLQLAKIERNRFRLQREPAQLNEIIEDVISGARAKTEEAGGTFLVNLNAPNRDLLADKLHLSSALSALLDNAVKYSLGAPEISVTTNIILGHTRLVIADKGVGIPVEHQSKVFEKFYRVPTGNVHDVKGFGLGLFYVNGICKAHGYELTLDETRTVGSAFRIDIPDRNMQDSFWRKLILRIFGPDKAPAWTQA
jgi:two-component system phosphate regulon sensor histidine kinase PhoR